MGKLHISQLKQGMVISESLVDEETGTLLLKQGARLSNVTIDKIISHGFTWLEVADPYTLLIRPEESMELLLQDCYRSAVRKILPRYREGSMNDAAFEAGNRVPPVIEKIIADGKIRQACINMEIVNFRSLLLTGIYTSVYSMFVAAVLELSDQELYDVGAAGLLHDIGLCEMPYLITTGEIPANMKALYSEHPNYAYYMLLEQEFPAQIAEIIRGHHERFDGEGFPQKQKWMEIPLGSRIVALCADYDWFVAVKGMPPYEAVEYMYGNSGFCYDKNVVKAFTENIPIYTLGSMVELTSGEIGIVVNIRKNKGPRPIVQVHYNRVKKGISNPYLVDLGEEKTVFIRKVINN